MTNQAGLLLQLYGHAQRSGLLKSPWFQRVFQDSYFVYKRFIEDPFHQLGQKHPELFRDGNVLDIGANIGYTTFVFSKFLSQDYRVFAFEPEPSNFSLLEQALQRNNISNKAVAIKSAVGATSGQIELFLNEEHHADHKIVTDKLRSNIQSAPAIAVPLTSIDDFARKQSSRFPVSFIKIDVQGYELAVCEGMVETLDSNADAIVAFEYSADSMEQLGFQPNALIDFFSTRTFNLYALHHDGSLEFVEPEQKNISTYMKQRPYIDFIASRRAIK